MQNISCCLHAMQQIVNNVGLKDTGEVLHNIKANAVKYVLEY